MLGLSEKQVQDGLGLVWNEISFSFRALKCQRVIVHIIYSSCVAGFFYKTYTSVDCLFFLRSSVASIDH